MNIEDIEVGKRYYVRIGFSTMVGIMMAKEKTVVVNVDGQLWERLPSDIIAELPPEPPRQTWAQWFAGFWK